MAEREVFGYESFQLEDLSNAFTREDLVNKEVVLISAPLDFDAKSLVGKTYLPNSSVLLDRQGEDGEAFEMKTASLHQELTMLLASSQSKQMVLSEKLIKENISIVESLHIPSIVYPKVTKKEQPIEKPPGLCTRWKPFGEDNPFKSRAVDQKNTKDMNGDMSIKKKKKKKKKRKREEDNNSENESVYSPTKIKKESSIDNEHDHTTDHGKTKKVKKKHKNTSDHDGHSSAKRILNSSSQTVKDNNIDNSSYHKKKKKHSKS